jgi:small subunit ribosomal protein S4
MIRKKKSYLRPKKMFEKVRIEEENSLLDKYALKNKREVWKSLAKIKYFRARAKDLAKASSQEQKLFFGKLTTLGIKVDSIADVLALKIENILDRRLPTLVASKGLAQTPRHARQLVVHKKILVNGKVVDSPGFIVSVVDEDQISLREKAKKKEVKAEVKEEVKAEESK